MEESSSNSNSSMRSKDVKSINEAFGSYSDPLTFSTNRFLTFNWSTYEFMVNDLLVVLKVTIDNLKDLAHGAHSI